MILIKYPLVFSLLVATAKCFSDNAELSRRDVNDRFCGRSSHSSAITHDGSLMIVGGSGIRKNASDPNGGTYVDHGVGSYVWIMDMSAKWETKLNPPLTFNETLPNGIIPRVCGSALFSRGTDQLWYGGERVNMSYSLSGPRVYVFDSLQKKWSQNPMSVRDLPGRACGSFAQDSEIGYYIGGLDGWNNNPRVDNFTLIDNMISIPLNGDPATTVSTDTLNQFGTVVRGSLTYISSVGKKGILVAIGGVMHDPSERWTWQRPIGEFLDMNSIAVFDIDSNKWYLQRATGAEVQPRFQFCSVLQSAPDNSSHHIYIYGGHNPYVGNLDDVKVLSIPSFIWSNARDTDDVSARTEHTCEKVNSQMIVVGGETRGLKAKDDPARNIFDGNFNTTCEPERMFRIFDTNSHQWVDAFDPNAKKFEVNADLTNNGATASKPAAGWNDGVESVFAIARQQQDSPTENNSTGSNKNKGAIIGGIIGGLAALAIIGIASFIILRRRRKSNSYIPALPRPPAAELEDDSPHYASQVPTEAASTERYELYTGKDQNGNELNQPHQPHQPKNQPAELDGRSLV